MIECIAPDEIKEGDLMEYVEGTAPQRVRDHVARCPACAAQAAALAQVDHTLRERLFRASCPTADVLLGYVTRTLPAGERRRVARHIEECPHCAAEVQELEQAGVASVPTLWQQVARAARALIEAIAVPPRPELVPALRGSSHHLRLFRAGDLDIALGSEVSGPGPVFRVRGRVMEQGIPSSRLAGHVVRLVQQDTVVARQQVDELGYFVFEEVPPGEYDLVLDYTDADIVIRHISLSPADPKGLQNP